MIKPPLERRLLLISRDDILGSDRRLGKRIYLLLAWFSRQGYHLLVTAPQTDRWLPDSDAADASLLGPESIRDQLNAAGGNLDGIYYVRKSLLTQRRNREEALNDILDRYALKSDYCYLLSGSEKFVQAALGLGIRATHLTRELPLENVLETMKEQASINLP